MEEDAITTGTQILASGAMALPQWILAVGSVGAMIAAWVAFCFAVWQAKRAKAQAERASEQADKANSYREDLTKTQDRIADTQHRIQVFQEQLEGQAEDRRRKRILKDIENLKAYIQWLYRHWSLGGPQVNMKMNLQSDREEAKRLTGIISDAHDDIRSILRNLILNVEGHILRSETMRDRLNQIISELEKLQAEYGGDPSPESSASPPNPSA